MHKKLDDCVGLYNNSGMESSFSEIYMYYQTFMADGYLALEIGSHKDARNEPLTPCVP